MPSSISWHQGKKSQIDRTLVVVNDLIDQLKSTLETPLIVCKIKTTVLSGCLFVITEHVPRASPSAQFFLGAKQTSLATLVPAADFFGRARLEVFDRRLQTEAYREMLERVVRDLNEIYIPATSRDKMSRDKIILVHS